MMIIERDEERKGEWEEGERERNLPKIQILNTSPQFPLHVPVPVISPLPSFPLPYLLSLTFSLSHRMLDIELESEDEDAIIERRRQLRMAIVQKYRNNSQPPTEVSSMNPSPAPPSEADSDAVGDEAAKDLEETIQQEEIKLKLKLSDSKEVGLSHDMWCVCCMNLRYFVVQHRFGTVFILFQC